MNYVRIVNRCAIIELADSDSSEHQDIIMDISKLLDMKFKLFLLDFRMVNKFSSHIFGFTLGIIKSVLTNVDCDSRIFVRGLGSVQVEMMQKAICMLDVTGEDRDLYGIDIKEVKLVSDLKREV
jgi:hypothetical protein